jgi:lipoate-protein ligase A
MSLILPRRHSEPAIDDAFELWIAILDHALRTAYDTPVGGAPVEGAFCPGRFDVVARGRKLAGVAQARNSTSVLVHGTILVDIDSCDYLAVIEAAERHITNSGACTYDRSRIVSLRELAGRSVTTAEAAAEIAKGAAGSLTPIRHADLKHEEVAG